MSTICVSMYIHCNISVFFRLLKEMWKLTLEWTKKKSYPEQPHLCRSHVKGATMWVGLIVMDPYVPYALFPISIGKSHIIRLWIEEFLATVQRRLSPRTKLKQKPVDLAPVEMSETKENNYNYTKHLAR